MDSSNDRIERLARRRAAAKMGWLIHATVYAVVNSLLLASPAWIGRDAGLVPLLGWGAGLMLHGLAVWLCLPGGSLREGLVERERRALMRAAGR